MHPLCRDDRKSDEQPDPKPLTGRAVGEVIFALLFLLMAQGYTPIGNLVLGFPPLPWWTWGPLILGGVELLGVEEFKKFVVNRIVVAGPRARGG